MDNNFEKVFKCKIEVKREMVGHTEVLSDTPHY